MATPARNLERIADEQRPRLRLVTPARDLPAVSIRTCASCGEHVAFVPEGTGCWYVCTACGRYA